MKTYRDPAAERRLDFALLWREQGDLPAALGAAQAALELEPEWPQALFLSGELLVETGAVAEAIETLCRYLSADPEDVMGASIKLAQLQALPTPEILPEAYVRTLFDQYADHFDAALVDWLAYRGPDVLRNLYDRLGRGQVARVLDLGCGTGLAGEAFRPVAGWLVGVDLSPGMLEQAAAKGFYDQLTEDEAHAYLEAPGPLFDLVVASDVVAYLGDLAPLLTACAARLVPGGLLLLTAQRCETADYLLGADSRFAHAPAYLERQATAAGFEVRALEDGTFRKEAGADLPGLIVALERRGATLPETIGANPHEMPLPVEPRILV